MVLRWLLFSLCFERVLPRGTGYAAALGWVALQEGWDEASAGEWRELESDEVLEKAFKKYSEVLKERGKVTKNVSTMPFVTKVNTWSTWTQFYSYIYLCATCCGTK